MNRQRSNVGSSNIILDWKSTRQWKWWCHRSISFDLPTAMIEQRASIDAVSSFRISALDCSTDQPIIEVADLESWDEDDDDVRAKECNHSHSILHSLTNVWRQYSDNRRLPNPWRNDKGEWADQKRDLPMFSSVSSSVLDVARDRDLRFYVQCLGRETTERNLVGTDHPRVRRHCGSTSVDFDVQSGSNRWQRFLLEGVVQHRTNWAHRISTSEFSPDDRISVELVSSSIETSLTEWSKIPQI